MPPTPRRQFGAYSSYCFTINNPTDLHYAQLLVFIHLCKYLIYGDEVAPETGTPHIQGYFSLKLRTRFNTVRGYLTGAHLTVARGTATQNTVYCSKGENIVTHGTITQGRRTDLDVGRTLALDAGMAAVTAQCGFQAIRTAQAFLKYNEPGMCCRLHHTQV